MNTQHSDSVESPHPHTLLANKIATLVQERGWNLEDFARISNLNRLTVRQILLGENSRKLRNATISQCAKALGLTVHELLELPLESLLPRMHRDVAEETHTEINRLAQVTQLELATWLQKHPDRFNKLSESEFQELLAMQGPESPFIQLGVEPFVSLIERRRNIIQKIIVISKTASFDLLDQLVDLLFEKSQRTLTAKI